MFNLCINWFNYNGKLGLLVSIRLIKKTISGINNYRKAKVIFLLTGKQINEFVDGGNYIIS
jgi:hypothetical protein